MAYDGTPGAGCSTGRTPTARSYADATSTSREIAFAKIEARVRGTRMAAEKLGL